MTKIAIIGAGNIGHAHATTFAGLGDDGVEVLAVADVNEDAARKVADEFEIPIASTKPGDVLALPDLDAVVITVPNRWHAELAIAALEAGTHVLLEKPMGATMADAGAIYRCVQEAGSVLMIAHQMRWIWWARAMRERLPECGRVYRARTGWMRRAGIPGWGTWFTQKALAGGGPLIDLGAHMLDVTLDLLGNPAPVRVSGTTGSAFGPRKRGIGKWGTPDWDGKFDVEDFASAMIRFEDGTTLGLDVSWAAHVDRPGEYVDLLGEDGGLSYHAGALKFLAEREGETVDEAIEPTEGDERLEMSREFVRCVRGESICTCDAYSGLVNNAVLDAIYRSAASGVEIEVDLPRN